jgi:hypothetical protein
MKKYQLSSFVKGQAVLTGADGADGANGGQILVQGPHLIERTSFRDCRINS